jgi:peptidoglycan hydrolase CwlO-like protein
MWRDKVMRRSFCSKRNIMIALIIIPVLALMPARVFGEVAPIEQAQERLTDLSEEEKKVLKDLFTLTQDIEKLEREEESINDQITEMKKQIESLEDQITRKQADYDKNLSTLKEVLVYYQRGGPATYLEILLDADSLSSFLKSINLIKDISRNTGELLDTIEAERLSLQKDRQVLHEKTLQLTEKRTELEKTIESKERVKQEQEAYLMSLKEEQAYYREQLEGLTLVWTDCKALFSDMVVEINRVIGEGYFTAQDLNLELGFITTKGALGQDTFNRVIQENTSLPEIRFHFTQGEVVIEVPEKYLVLYGNFAITDKKAITYEVTSGTFYDLPLNEASIMELFQYGPLLIDFASISGELLMIDFILQRVESISGSLAFEIELQW